MDFTTRVRLQSEFHTMLEIGATIHTFVGRERPPRASVVALVRETCEHTVCTGLAISPDFTKCRAWGRATDEVGT